MAVSIFLKRRHVQLLLLLLALSFLMNVWIMNLRIMQHPTADDCLNSHNKRDCTNPKVPQQQQQQQQQTRQQEEDTVLPPLSSIVSGYNITGDASWLLNYAIVGFPKTGTSSMMYYLNQFQISHQVEIFQEERCEMGYNQHAKLIAALYKDLPHTAKIRMIKCPRDLEVDLALKNYELYFPKTDFLVGLRHPVKWFESFYNFRIHNQFDMPPAEELIGRCKRKNVGVCTFRANFHLFLANLGKTNVLNDPKELELFDPQYRKLIRPINNTISINSFTQQTTRQRRVFLWEVSQLHTNNNDTILQFQKDLHQFLFPTEPAATSFPPMIWNKPGLDYTKRKYDDNVTEQINQRKINICDERYNRLRQVLVRHGTEASLWMRNYFFKSPDVFVSNPNHFANVLLKQWEQDPCSTTDMRL